MLSHDHDYIIDRNLKFYTFRFAQWQIMWDFLNCVNLMKRKPAQTTEVSHSWVKQVVTPFTYKFEQDRIRPWTPFKQQREKAIGYCKVYFLRISSSHLTLGYLLYVQKRFRLWGDSAWPTWESGTLRSEKSLGMKFCPSLHFGQENWSNCRTCPVWSNRSH